MASEHYERYLAEEAQRREALASRQPLVAAPVAEPEPKQKGVPFWPFFLFWFVLGGIASAFSMGRTGDGRFDLAAGLIDGAIGGALDGLLFGLVTWAPVRLLVRWARK